MAKYRLDAPAALERIKVTQKKTKQLSSELCSTGGQANHDQRWQGQHFEVDCRDCCPIHHCHGQAQAWHQVHGRLARWTEGITEGHFNSSWLLLRTWQRPWADWAFCQWAGRGGQSWSPGLTPFPQCRFYFLSDLSLVWWSLILLIFVGQRRAGRVASQTAELRPWVGLQRLQQDPPLFMRHRLTICIILSKTVSSNIISLPGPQADYCSSTAVKFGAVTAVNCQCFCKRCMGIPWNWNSCITFIPRHDLWYQIKSFSVFLWKWKIVMEAEMSRPTNCKLVLSQIAKLCCIE